MPQIEIMRSDLPHTLYMDSDKVKKADIEDAERKMMELIEKRRKEHEQSERQLTIDEVFTTK